MNKAYIEELKKVNFDKEHLKNFATKIFYKKPYLKVDELKKQAVEFVHHTNKQS